MWVTKLLISRVKKRIFLPQNDPIWPEIGISIHFGPGLAGSVGALSVGWLVVVARGLYLARHLFTLYNRLEGGVVYKIGWKGEFFLEETQRGNLSKNFKKFFIGMNFPQ